MNLQIELELPIYEPKPIEVKKKKEYTCEVNFIINGEEE